MLVISRRIEAQAREDGVLRLPFDLRCKSRLRTALVSGEAVGLFLNRGEVLRAGDFLQAEDGRVVRVEAEEEPVLQVSCKDARALARIAYHLGNRHVPLQVDGDWLRLRDDHVLLEMVRRLGARVERRHAPFEPEAGAYGDHAHQAAPPTHGGIIHEFVAKRP